MAPLSYGQIAPNPIIGQSLEYRELEVTLADTGLVGTGVLWDFSNLQSASTHVETITYRLPNTGELGMSPTVNFVEESSDGIVNLYVKDATSIDLFYSVQPGVEHTYTNSRVDFFLPFQGNTTYSDDFGYSYQSNGSTVVTEGTRTWKKTGEGTLKTPSGEYYNVQKVSSTTHLEIFWNGISVMTIEMKGVAFVDAALQKVYVFLQNDDFSGSTMGKFLSNEELITASVSSLTKESDDFHVFPNPARDWVQIANTDVSFSLKNVSGQQILTGVGRTVDLKSLPSGTYFVEVQEENTVQVLRFEKL